MLRLRAPLKAAAAPAVPLIDVVLCSALLLQEPAQTWARMHHKHRTGTYRHVGLAARACTNTSTHESQTQARTQHKPPFLRLPGGLRLLSSASLGGSLFCPCRQRRPRTSPRPGVRVHGSTHRTFLPVTASMACAGRARRPALLRVTPSRLGRVCVFIAISLGDGLYPYEFSGF
jgi:hypothetical protein